MASRNNSVLFVLLTLGSVLAVGIIDVDLYDNLALNKEREQSSTHIPAGSAENGNDGDRNNDKDYPGNSCIHTQQSPSTQEAWWRVNLGFITRIHEIKITYRELFANRLAGFSIFVSNTTDFKTGTRCYKQNGDLPSVATTSYPCTAIGQYVTVYNDRFIGTTYPSGYNTGGAILELCEVEVPGCNSSHYGQNCGSSCYCKGLTCDYKTGDCDGDCQPGYTGDACNISCNPGYFGDKCLSQCPNCGGGKKCNQSGVCTQGCEAGYFPGQSPGCPQICGQCVGVACNTDGTCPNGCDDGYYLPTCNGSCPGNCYNRKCHQSSGNCLSCKDGYYGPECDKKCSDNCLNEKCNKDTGYCLACDPRYYGVKCSSLCQHCGGAETCNQSGICLNGCEVGFYQDDSKICSKQCGQCNGTLCNLDGSCPGGCDNGYYTIACTTKCPNNCHERCDMNSGKCVACKNGYFDEHCDAECPQFCLQNKCDLISGQCIGCEPGRYGDKCSNECLHCGGNGTCNDLGFCLHGCETGYLSDYSPGCSVEREDTLTLPLAIGISSGIILLIGTIVNILWTRRKRAQPERRSQIYMQPIDKNQTEHVYSDIQPGIQNTNLALDEEFGGSK